MHHFERGQSPVDLQAIARKGINWSSFAGSHAHRIVGDALYERQHHYCAYCEVFLEQKTDGHTEHLARRSDFPQRTFDWYNLFFSCNHIDSCGRFKDNSRIQFDVNDIIDPSRENPQDFFNYDRFGHIFPRVGLSELERRRACETIRVFNLDNSGRLCNIRQQAFQAVVTFLQCSEHPDTSTIDRFLEMVNGGHCISVYYTLLDKRMR